jgi:alpha-beta hydrolase superfamily lysophospholipase
MKETIETVQAVDGYPLRYRSWQTGTSDTLVVTLHGVLTHSGWFSGLADSLLARGIHVIGHDRRGSGLNEQDRGDVDGPDRLLEDLGSVVAPQRQRYRTILYLGWCLGSTVALRFLLKRPELGEGLLLMSPDIYECHVNDKVRTVFSDPKWDTRVLPRLTVPIAVEVYTDTEYLDGFIRPDKLKLKDFTPRFLRATMRLKESLEENFAAFRKPSMLILAGRDRIIDNARTEELYRHIGSSASEVVVLDCNHGIMFEAQEPLANLIERFGSSTRGAQAA